MLDRSYIRIRNVCDLLHPCDTCFHTVKTGSDGCSVCWKTVFHRASGDFSRKLPESLDVTCEHVLMEIKKPNRDHAQSLLKCLVVAIRSPRVEELAEVLAIDFNDAEEIPKLDASWRWGGSRTSSFNAIFQFNLGCRLRLLTRVDNGD